jgi:hypothetical protein
VPERWRADDFTGVRQSGEVLADSRVTRDVGDARGGPDSKGGIGAPCERIATVDRSQVDQRRRRDDPFFDTDEQVGAATEYVRTWLAK